MLPHSIIVRVGCALFMAVALWSSGALAADVPRARFSDALSYVGPARLPLAVALLEAGGGIHRFKAAALVDRLAGGDGAAERAKLIRLYGPDQYAQFEEVLTFAIADHLRIAHDKNIALPRVAMPNPRDGRALAAALHRAGVDRSGHFDVEYLLDNLGSHPVHVAVMDDIDAKYGRRADAMYHVIYSALVTDLGSAKR